MLRRESSWLDDLVLVLIAALIYLLSYLSTYQLSSLYEFSHATSWVYLPSGVRLLLVLVLMETGAVGILLGTLTIDYYHNLSLDHAYNWITASVAGSSAYLGLKLAQMSLQLRDDLYRLNQWQLMQVCIIFSIVSPVMHQIWYWIHGDTEHFWHSVAVMALGDLGGSVIVLGALYWVLRFFRMLRTP
jgi:hypothetical protein